MQLDIGSLRLSDDRSKYIDDGGACLVHRFSLNQCFGPVHNGGNYHSAQGSIGLLLMIGLNRPLR
jgi:hypothetical protein